MRNTLYEEYYQLDYEKIGNFKDEADLGRYCDACTGSVTTNGKAIERCMVVTTHNLALVFEKLDMRERFQDLMPALARRIFNFIIRETDNLVGMDWQTRLQHLKNASYAFRQMVFFLSFLSREEQASFFEWVFARVNKLKDEGYKSRLLLPVQTLHASWTGTKQENRTIFNGWVGQGERHFLMPPKQNA